MNLIRKLKKLLKKIHNNNNKKLVKLYTESLAFYYYLLNRFATLELIKIKVKTIIIPYKNSILPILFRVVPKCNQIIFPGISPIMLPMKYFLKDILVKPYE